MNPHLAGSSAIQNETKRKRKERKRMRNTRNRCSPPYLWFFAFCSHSYWPPIIGQTNKVENSRNK
jgi:hypothetical protein